MAEHNYQHYCKFLTSHGFSAQINSNNDITIDLQINNRTLGLKVFLPKLFPNALPKFYLLDRFAYGLLPHVSTRDDGAGTVCIGEYNQYCLDVERPEHVLLETLQKAKDMLARLLTDRVYFEEEAYKEFVAIWNFKVKAGTPSIKYFGDDEDSLSELKVKCSQDKKLKLNAFFAEGKSSLNKDFLVYSKYKKTPLSIRGKGVFIDIPAHHLILPPSPTESVSEWWKKQIQKLPLPQKQELKRYAKNNRHNSLNIILSSIVKGQRIWVALYCVRDNDERLPLHESHFKHWHIEPAIIDVISRHSLLYRSGASTKLGDAKVCVIGCGSVGGHVVDKLASSGVGHITICDQDNFNLENIHRHVLPSYCLDKSKCLGLVMEVSSKYPYCDIKISGKNSLAECQDTKFIENFDLIICATGDETEERSFNSWIYKAELNNTPVVIYSWLEALGLGGHVITTIPKVKGCLNCCYIDNVTDEPSTVSNISFISPNQEVMVSYAGCGTHFLPFSGLDAQDTASLSVRTAINCLNARPQQGFVSSWVGTPDEALSKGIDLTHRYYHHRDGSLTFEHYRKACNVCQ
ncbi:ThiF family adenylyltransferase [Catenovulum adriaticum]|uniref:ThiF family adenylyltransferase n=1 Tax=Catenovulum adriaticum TaxID=2984846 RepID=A0ABY7AK62_9ALTE|nr:ThiF family adenylyltransferase [Catenovulum sp. TS8]WAJ69531.1 ThiF family adenylyltransferase [Catenovulum sp. TS8]